MLTLKTRAEFHTLLDAAALTNQGQKPAIIYLETGQEPITVSTVDFQTISGRYAGALQAAGIMPRDLVMIAHTQNLESIYAFWGALRMGAIPSMFPTLTEKLDPTVYMQQMAELIRFSGVRAVLTTDEFKPQLAPVADCLILGSSDIQQSEAFTPYEPESDTIAFLQHSSGTTGLQKGVALSHRAVLNQLAAYSEPLQLSESDVIVSWLPLYHDMGLIAGFLLPLIQGIPLILMSPFDWVKHPALLLRAIHDYRGTLCWLPNFAYNHMTRRIRKRDTEGLDLSSIRAFINCSEPVHHESHQQFLDRYAANGIQETMLTVSYAMAENTFAVTQTLSGQKSRLDAVDRRFLQEKGIATPIAPQSSEAVLMVSCGAVIPNTRICVLNEEGQEVPERHVGELAVQSDCMLTGYYQRPDLNPFVSGWYRTGDMGYLAEGEVYVIGRKKDLIINAGKNVYPQDLEAIINTVEGVHPGRAVVFGVPDEREGTELIAVVAEVDTLDPDQRKAISAAIRQIVVSQTTVTVHFVHLVEEKWLLKTSSGKIARAANRAKWQAETHR